MVSVKAFYNWREVGSVVFMKTDFFHVLLFYYKNSSTLQKFYYKNSSTLQKFYYKNSSTLFIERLNVRNEDEGGQAEVR